MVIAWAAIGVPLTPAKFKLPCEATMIGFVTINVIGTARRPAAELNCTLPLNPPPDPTGTASGSNATVTTSAPLPLVFESTIHGALGVAVHAPAFAATVT